MSPPSALAIVGSATTKLHAASPVMHGPSIACTRRSQLWRAARMGIESACGRPTINEKECDMAEELWRASAVELAAGIRAKRFSCVEVMTSVVERIRALNPRLNAIVIDLTEQALAEARAADHALAHGA